MLHLGTLTLLHAKHEGGFFYRSWAMTHGSIAGMTATGMASRFLALLREGFLSPHEALSFKVAGHPRPLENMQTLNSWSDVCGRWAGMRACWTHRAARSRRCSQERGCGARRCRAHVPSAAWLATRCRTCRVTHWPPSPSTLTRAVRSCHCRVLLNHP